MATVTRAEEEIEGKRRAIIYLIYKSWNLETFENILAANQNLHTRDLYLTNYNFVFITLLLITLQYLVYRSCMYVCMYVCMSSCRPKTKRKMVSEKYTYSITRVCQIFSPSIARVIINTVIMHKQ